MAQITVLMSVHNDGKYLSKAIESILNQSFDDFEFLIFNDGSTDDSVEILQVYQKKDARIKLVEQQNIGLTKTLNKGLGLACGKYIARMDSDDVSDPNRLIREKEFLDNNPDIVLVGTFAKVIDGNDNIVGAHQPAINHSEIVKFSFFSGQLAHPSVMFRKKEILELGGYDEKIKYAQDADLWFKLMKKYKVANIPEYLLKWRITKSGIGVEKRKEQLSSVQKSKIKAIRNGIYPKFYYLFLVWPYLRKFIPIGLKNYFKKLFK